MPFFILDNLHWIALLWLVCGLIAAVITRSRGDSSLNGFFMGPGRGRG